jgi:hypothetical protein
MEDLFYFIIITMLDQNTHIDLFHQILYFNFNFTIINLINKTEVVHLFSNFYFHTINFKLAIQTNLITIIMEVD